MQSNYLPRANHFHYYTRFSNHQAITLRQDNLVDNFLNHANLFYPQKEKFDKFKQTFLNCIKLIDGSQSFAKPFTINKEEILEYKAIASHISNTPNQIGFNYLVNKFNKGLDLVSSKTNQNAQTPQSYLPYYSHQVDYGFQTRYFYPHNPEPLNILPYQNFNSAYQAPLYSPPFFPPLNITHYYLAMKSQGISHELNPLPRSYTIYSTNNQPSPSPTILSVENKPSEKRVRFSDVNQYITY